jgi:hypothetical protein
MKKSVFIITKPLQYVNASNIEDYNLKDCIISNTFHNAEEFSNIVEEYSDRWAKVKFCKDTLSALKYTIKNRHQYSRLYIDSDFGILLSFYLYKLGPIQIYTYEEGYASYLFIRNGNTFVSKLKRFVSKILGLKNWVGGHPKTKGMYLYQPEKFNKNIGEQNKKFLMTFKQPFFEHLKSLKEISVLFNDLDIEAFRGEDIVLYMTNYYINDKAINLLTSYPNHLKIIKPHPQLSEMQAVFSKFDIVIENYLPAEILIEKILSLSNSLLIIHEGSFALEYFKRNENINEILLNGK